MSQPVNPQSWQLGPVGGSPPGAPVESAPKAAPEALRPTSLGAPGPALRGTAADPKPQPDMQTDKQAMSFMPAPRRSQARGRTALWIVIAAVAMAAVAWVAHVNSAVEPVAVTPVAAAPAPDGSVNIISRPDGAQVFINGAARGVTPLKLSLAVGTYTMELQSGTGRRSLPLTIEAGAIVKEYVDLTPSGTSLGRLEVTSEPAGAQVIVDGTPRGVTPLALDEVAPGSHRVAISSGTSVVNRSVQVSAGATATVVASLTPAGAAGGWISIKSPIELEVLENGQVLGTTSMDRLMLPAGKHEFEFVSKPFAFDTTMTTQVTAGKTETVNVELPTGTLSINALPWAEVWVDGVDKGPTPLGNLSVPIGNHEIVWRHPQLGERRQTVKVTAGAPVRAGMDLTK